MRRKSVRITSVYWLFDTRPETIAQSGWACGVPFYCGKTTKAPRVRLSEHKRSGRKLIGSRSEQQKNVQMLAKCGEHVRIDVLEIVPPDGDWCAAERKWIKCLRTLNPLCTNETDGGSGFPGFVRTPEIIEIVRKKNTGRRNPPEVIERMRAAKKGAKGCPLSPEHKAALLVANTGRTMSEGSRRQLSESVKKNWELRHSRLLNPKILKRNILVHQMHAEGYSLQEIGLRVGLTKQRVWQLLKPTKAQLSEAA